MKSHANLFIASTLLVAAFVSWSTPSSATTAAPAVSAANTSAYAVPVTAQSVDQVVSEAAPFLSQTPSAAWTSVDMATLDQVEFWNQELETVAGLMGTCAGVQARYGSESAALWASYFHVVERYEAASWGILDLVTPLMQELAWRTGSAAQQARADDITTRWSIALDRNVRRMRDAQQSYNPQYLSLQSQLSQENRWFTLVSNIMKTKSDTARNALDNIR